MNATRLMWLRLTLLGVLSGVLGGAVVLLFHACIDLGQAVLLPLGHGGNYEGLAPWQRLALPVAGGLLLGLAFDLLPPEYRQIGIPHLLRCLQHPGPKRLPWPNLVVQFLGATAAILSGHSVDKEGPSVHIGAASAGLAGQGLRQATEADQTLIACGGAAAIAAAFGTPLAGVIFVVEVLKIRYEVSRFLPVIVASVCGAVLSRLALGGRPVFEGAAGHHLVGHWEYVFLVVLGIALGLLAILFIQLCETVALRASRWRARVAFPLAGLLTGILAQWTPEVMGTSFDTLEVLLTGESGLGLGFVLALALAKLVATGTAVGLRVPGGLIGPTLFMGGALGTGFGMLVAMLPVETASSGFYAVVGMVAMMGATLRAPLAALAALLELTGNPNIILAGMLAVASAELTNRLALGKDSVFDTLLKVLPVPPHKSDAGA